MGGGLVGLPFRCSVHFVCGGKADAPCLSLLLAARLPPLRLHRHPAFASRRNAPRGRRAGVLPTLQDWESHLTTVFPEVRRSLQRSEGQHGAP